MNVRTSKLYLLGSPAYLASAGLLLLNDFWLKKEYPCWVTGKLSDFAGLFALSVFLLLIWPKRSLLVGLAVGFALWKSSLSQPVIVWLSGMIGWNIGRTIDYTDLIAIASLPLAWIFHQNADPARVRIGWCLMSWCVSLFAFAATTKAPTPEQRAAFAAAVAEYNFTERQPTYGLPFSRKELYLRIEGLGFRVSGSTGLWPDFNKHSAYIVPRRLPEWRKPRVGNVELFEAIFDVDNAPTGVIVRVTKLEVKRGSESIDAATAVKMFDDEVIAPLRKQARSTAR